jgi:hypothetical protein
LQFSRQTDGDEASLFSCSADWNLRHTRVTIEVCALQAVEKKSLWQPNL